MTPKRPILFLKITAIVMVFLLAITYVSAFLPPWAYPGPIGELWRDWYSLQWQWLVSNALGIKPEYHGVDPQTYAESSFNWWETLAYNKYNTIVYLSDQLSRTELYWVRKAEYQAYKEIGNKNPSEQSVMLPVISELCGLQRQIYRQIKEVGLFPQLESLGESFSGDLSDYYVVLAYPTDAGALKYYDITRVGYDLVYIADGNGKVWNCNTLTLEDAQPGRAYDMGLYIVLAPGHFTILLNGHEIDRIALIRSSQQPSDNGEISDPNLSRLDTHYLTNEIQNKIELYEALDNFNAKFRQIYEKAWNFAQSYHAGLRALGYTDPNQVPRYLICPPPDVAFYSMDVFTEKQLTMEQILLAYTAYLNKLGDFFGNTTACLVSGSGGLNITTTTKVTTETVITGGTTTTITTVINGTTTTVTSIINGTQTVITTTRTYYVVVTPDNVYTTDFETKLLDVQVCLPNGECFTAKEIVIIDITEPVTFRKGENTTLNNLIRAFVNFGNGTVTMMDLPAGTTLAPSNIVTHTKDKTIYHDSYTYGTKKMSEWLYEYYDIPPYKETSSDSSTYKDLLALAWVFVSIIMAFAPILIIVALINMIPQMIRSSKRSPILGGDLG